MDRAKARSLREQLQSGLATALESDGLSVSVSGGRYSADGYVEYKVTIAEQDESGAGLTPERASLRRYITMLGLPADLEEMEINIGGKLVKVVGYAPRRRKYPFSVEVVGSGAKLKTTERAVKYAAGVK